MKKALQPANLLPGLVLALGLGAAGWSAWRATGKPPEMTGPQSEAELRRQLDALRDSTPESAATLETRLAAARASLPDRDRVDAVLKECKSHGAVEIRPSGQFDGFETRTCTVVFSPARLDSWPEILQVVKKLCAEPGISIDRLVLEAAPDGGGLFREARVEFTARLQNRRE